MSLQAQRVSNDPHVSPDAPTVGVSGYKKLDRKCKLCNKTFKKTEHMLRHNRSHTKEKPFRCAWCGKVYGRYDTLVRHTKVHTSEKDTSNSEQIPKQSQQNEAIDFQTPFSDSDQSHSTTQAASAGKMASQNAHLSYGISDAVSNAQPYPQNHSQTQNDSENGQHSFERGSDSAQQVCIPFLPGSGNMAHQLYPSHPLDPNLLTQVSPQSFPTVWDHLAISPGPLWWTGYDLDLDALNTSISVPMGTDSPLFQPTVSDVLNPKLLSPSPKATEQDLMQYSQKSAYDMVEERWFTKVEGTRRADESQDGATAMHIIPDSLTDQFHVDDNFRHRDALKLKERVSEEPLPSINYLNISVHTFFTKFNTMFPLIHNQTFRPTPKNSLLLLSISSLGSLLMGSKAAVSQGFLIFERLNKALLASWESYLLSESIEAASMIKAVVIGQTVGLLSGNPKHLAIVEAFNGTVISIARRMDMLKYQNHYPNVESLSGEALDTAWRVWARAEELVRASLTLYMQDAILASISHHQPLLRHDAISICSAADDEIFSAPSSILWKGLILRSSQLRPSLGECVHTNLDLHVASEVLPQELRHKDSQFTCYVLLAGIFAKVIEKQQMGKIQSSSTNFTRYMDALICWYNAFGKDTTDASSFLKDRFCLSVLWHTTFMNLLVDFDILERAIGRDGSRNVYAISDAAYVSKWAKSVDAQRCLLHANALQLVSGQIPLIAESPLHVPHGLFQAGIVSYCCMHFNGAVLPLPVNDEDLLPAPKKFPELVLRNIKVPRQLMVCGDNSRLGERFVSVQEDTVDGLGQRIGSYGVGTFSTSLDLLQRIGHWGITRKYANTLESLARVNMNGKTGL